MALEVDVEMQSATTGGSPPAEDQVTAWVTAALAAAGVDGHYELAVRVVDENESQALNSTWRARDKATNVLSFPFEALAGMPDDVVQPLGDIVVCAPVVLREAAEQGKNAVDHWAHMVVHGSLHLLGYDHETEEQAAPMEALEAEILKNLGIDNPYGRSQ